MSIFPAIAQVLDPLDGPVGPMTTGNWRQDGLGDTAMAIVAGGGAQSATGSVLGQSFFFRPTASASYAFATATVLPASGTICSVAAIDSIANPNLEIACGLSVALNQIQLTTPGGSVNAAITPSNGDSFGFSYDPSTDIATAWYRAVGSVAWVPKTTKVATLATVPSGWWLAIAGSDAAAMRLRNFGGGTLPGDDPTLNQPNVRGRGAC